MTALTRDALIEAAAAEVVTRAIMMAGAEISASDLVEFALDAVLPLIADAIKDVDDRTWTSRTVKRSVDWHRGMQRGARLVRSLGGGQ